ncbi:hypothetical protein RRG08_019567 [Elysia crispata]|uniref:Uncharacterized protein n=1 Tax=Elysia crispata TaxID=231223 RepID=A0AAE1D3H0_9GAST|nr:hypothetical protein RRG08_019567 [Elysia crispata]
MNNLQQQLCCDKTAGKDGVAILRHDTSTYTECGFWEGTCNLEFDESPQFTRTATMALEVRARNCGQAQVKPVLHYRLSKSWRLSDALHAKLAIASALPASERECREN